MHSKPYRIDKPLKFLREIECLTTNLGANDCWIWGSLRPSGYGSGNYGKGGRIHKVSFSLFECEVPAGLVLAHLCSNRGCCNPHHLVISTVAQNNWHKTSKTSDDLSHEDLIKRAHDRLTKARRISIADPIPTPDEIAKFWALVDKEAVGECWNWIGKTSGKNYPYGKFYWRDYGRLAHHVSFFLHAGRWPDDAKEISHSCRNTLCVRKDHLQEMTRLEHVSYASKMGWLSEGHKGQRCNTKINDEAIRYIKEAYRDRSVIRATVLADELETNFGIVVTAASIAPIRQGKRGTHVVVPGFQPIERVIAKKAPKQDICQIIELIKEGKTQKEIAKIMARSQQSVSRIVRKKTEEDQLRDNYGR